MLKEGKDPAQKLKELHNWLLTNKVQSRLPEKAVPTTAWATKHSQQTSRELAEFTDWIKDIQSTDRRSEVRFS